jgi:hypothetical protein
MIFDKALPERGALRQAIDAHYRADETACVRTLVAQLDDLPRSGHGVTQPLVHRRRVGVRVVEQVDAVGNESETVG